MDGMMQLQLTILFGLFVVSAFFVMAETALIGMNRIKILAHIKNNHPGAKYLQVWINEPNKVLASLSICINTVAITASTIGAFLSLRLADIFKFSPPLTATIVAAIITVILIVFGEISPKIFAIHNTEKLGLLLIRPIVIIYRIIRPMAEIFVRMSNLVIKMFGGQPSSGIPMVTSKDINTVIDVSVEQGYLGEQEKTMMAGILEMKELQAKNIMVPRTAIVGIDIDGEIDRVIDKVIEDGYSRLPVYKDHLDNIIGIVYTKDMLSMIKNRGLIIFQDLVRTPYFIPESKNIGDLLKEFRKGHIHMAIVVDEFGGTSGLVTIEDILEEIVGDISDEYDIVENIIRKISEGVYDVDAVVELSRINKDLELEIPEDEEINTIGGFVMALFGHVPKNGETTHFGDTSFTIIKSDQKKIDKIRITCTPPEADTKAPEGRETSEGE
jgi:putative hemolysin